LKVEWSHWVDKWQIPETHKRNTTTNVEHGKLVGFDSSPLATSSLIQVGLAVSPSVSVRWRFPREREPSVGPPRITCNTVAILFLFGNNCLNID
jgi:hypothetical protein